MECIKIVNYNVLVNGKTIEPFNTAKGLQQGDPISLFLFAIVMEYLSRYLNELKKEPTFQHHPRSRKLDITHMSFVDDLLLFAKGNLSSVTTLYKYFSQFSEASGLQANLGKSSVYFGGVKQDVKKQIWITWDLNKLVQSVIFGIQAYWVQLFIFPAKVLKMIEELCRSYIWSGTNTITKKTLMAWEKICTPKSAGGLNLINLPLWNKAAIAKTCWDLAHKQDKFWIRWINAYYIKKQQLQHMPIPQQASWMERRIIGSRGTMLQAQNSSDHNTSSIRQIYLQLLGELPRWIIKQGKGKFNKASIFRMIYAEISYALWIERNTRTFEQRSRDNAVLAGEIAYICNIRVAARAKNHIQQFLIEE
nr:uncharacterized protein LOC104093492 [Nicotiana tomentosiformis]